MQRNASRFQRGLIRILFLLTSIGYGNQLVPTDSLIGSWKGQAKIIVTWVKQDSLPIHIHIKSNGEVTGRIGDAVLKDGRLENNHWILRLLGNSHYRISGNLEGAMIKNENITRKSLQYLLFNFRETGLEGGLHTSGGILLKEGPKLTAAGLILRKIPNNPKKG